MSEKPFAMLYRWRIDAAHEAEFCERWRAATVRLRDDHGALGSCLSRDAEGNFIAFARWPSEKHREQAVANGIPTDPFPGVMQFEQTKLWVEADLLLG